MKISLNIQVILSIILGIVLFWNSSSAIAEIPEPSLTPLSNNEKLESGKTDSSLEHIQQKKPDYVPTEAGNSPLDCEKKSLKHCEPEEDNHVP